MRTKVGPRHRSHQIKQRLRIWHQFITQEPVPEMGNSHNTLTVTPSMLETFERCPYQFRHRYVHKIRSVGPLSQELASAITAHEVIAGAFEEYRRHRRFPADLRKRVEAKLPRASYSDAATWQADAAKVLEWAAWTVSQFEPTDKILAAEYWAEYDFPGDASCPAFRLRHRVDLIVEHPNRRITHIDWKTGKAMQANDIENVSARIVVGHVFPGRPTILSATGFLTHRQVVAEHLDDAAVASVWNRIKALVASIATETEFAPLSNGLCEWCPCYQHGCPIYPAPNTGPDLTTTWLTAIEAQS